jgi:hypothetical protein
MGCTYKIMEGEYSLQEQGLLYLYLYLSLYLYLHVHA